MSITVTNETIIIVKKITSAMGLGLMIHDSITHWVVQFLVKYHNMHFVFLNRLSPMTVISTSVNVFA